jgi:hypothetical protein
VKPTADLFGKFHEGCPDEDDLTMWLTYSCNEGEDETYISNPDSCDGGSSIELTTPQPITAVQQPGSDESSESQATTAPTTPVPHTEETTPEEIPWLNECSFKRDGERVDENVLACGGRIHIKCFGGCIKIHKIVYDCQSKDISPSETKIVKKLCERKEHCTVEPSEELFGKKLLGCPSDHGYRDNEGMQITYSCDGARDETTVTNPKTCLQTLPGKVTRYRSTKIKKSKSTRCLCKPQCGAGATCVKVRRRCACQCPLGQVETVQSIQIFTTIFTTIVS